MRCKQSEKRMSDLLDGSLSARMRKSLDDHLRRCEGCRAYQQRLETIRRQSKNLFQAASPPEDFSDFNSRLEAGLRRVKPSEPSRLHSWRWGWLPAAGSVLVALFLTLWLFRPGPKINNEVYVLSFDEAIGQVVHEIGSDEELATAFNSLILVAIEEVVLDSSLEARDVTRNPILWEDLSDDDWRLLESEIKKEEKS